MSFAPNAGKQQPIGALDQHAIPVEVETVQDLKTPSVDEPVSLKLKFDASLLEPESKIQSLESQSPQSISSFNTEPSKGAAQLTQSEVPQSAAQNGVLRAAIALNMRDQSWGTRLVSQIEKMHSEGVAHYEISLRPKNFGDMQINLEVSGDDTQVRIVTETTAAARALIGAEDRLSQLMDAAGYRLSSLSASMSPGPNAGSGQGQSNKQRNQVSEITGKVKNLHANSAGETRVATIAASNGGVNVIA